MSRQDRSVLWALLLLLAGLLLVFQSADYVGLWTVYPQREIFGRDFYGAYYVGALALPRPDAQLYEGSAYLAWQSANGLPAWFDAEYPPFTYLLYTPFTRLAPHDAIMLDFYVLHGMLLLSVLIGVLGLAPARARLPALILGWLAVLLAAPSVELLLSGQTGGLLLLLMTIFAVLYVREHRTAAALALAVAIAVKITPAVLLLYLLLKRDFRTAGYTLAALIALHVPLLAYLGPSRFAQLAQDYVAWLPHVGRTIVVVSNQSLGCFVEKWFIPSEFGTPLLDAPVLGRVLDVIGNLVLIAVTCRGVRPRDHDPATVCAELSPFVLLQLLCLGRSWSHYHVYVLLAVGLTLVALPNVRKRSRLYLTGLLLLAPLLLFDGVVTGHRENILMRLALQAWHVPFFCLLGLWIVALIVARRVETPAGAGSTRVDVEARH